jgi:hypothetical protein
VLIEAKRLVVRPLNPFDVKASHRIASDPPVVCEHKKAWHLTFAEMTRHAVRKPELQRSLPGLRTLHTATSHRAPDRLRIAAKKSLATTYSPTAVRRSTIGAGGLNFRVRNGNGWIPSALVTRQLNAF